MPANSPSVTSNSELLFDANNVRADNNAGVGNSASYVSPAINVSRFKAAQLQFQLRSVEVLAGHGTGLVVAGFFDSHDAVSFKAITTNISFTPSTLPHLGIYNRHTVTSNYLYTLNATAAAVINDPDIGAPGALTETHLINPLEPFIKCWFYGAVSKIWTLDFFRVYGFNT